MDPALLHCCPSPGRLNSPCTLVSSRRLSRGTMAPWKQNEGNARGMERTVESRGWPMALGQRRPWHGRERRGVRATGSTLPQVGSQRMRTDGCHFTGDPVAFSFRGRKIPPGQTFLTAPSSPAKAQACQGGTAASTDTGALAGQGSSTWAAQGEPDRWPLACS